MSIERDDDDPMAIETARMFYERALKAEAEVDRLRARLDVMPYESDLHMAREDERTRIVERLLHAANLLDPEEVSRTALTLEKMAMVLVVEADVEEMAA